VLEKIDPITKIGAALEIIDDHPAIFPPSARSFSVPSMNFVIALPTR
jgi:hypothetical protein